MVEDLKNELGLSMGFARESTGFAKEDLVVFPPINHENLSIDGLESPSEFSSPRLSDSSSSSSLSPSDSDGNFEFDRKLQCRQSESDGKSPPFPSHLRVESSSPPPPEPDGKSRWKSLYYYSTFEIDIIQGWYKLLLARVLPNFQKMLTCFSGNNLFSFSRTLRPHYPVLFIVILWWIRNRARRRLHKGEIEARLRNTIKERDERIVQLLHQIAHMNELLVKKKLSN